MLLWFFTLKNTGLIMKKQLIKGLNESLFKNALLKHIEDIKTQFCPTQNLRVEIVTREPMSDYRTTYDNVSRLCKLSRRTGRWYIDYIEATTLKDCVTIVSFTPSTKDRNKEYKIKLKEEKAAAKTAAQEKRKKELLNIEYEKIRAREKQKSLKLLSKKLLEEREKERRIKRDERTARRRLQRKIEALI